MDTSIFYDPARQRAVVMHGGKPLGRAFQPLTEGNVHLDAPSVAKWFLFGLRIAGVHPKDFEEGEFVQARSAAYRIMGSAASTATAMQLQDGNLIGKVIEAGFRGLLHDYASAVVQISRERLCTCSEAAQRLNDKLEDWSWGLEPAKADVLLGIEPEQQSEEESPRQRL